MTSKIALSLRNTEPLYDDAASAGAGGSWTGPVTKSFLVVGLPYYNLASTDYFGYLRACPAGWENVSISTNDKVALNWTLPASQSFEKILILSQTGPSFVYGADCQYKLTDGWLVDGGASSTELLNNTGLSTLTGGVPAAYPTISLGPVQLPPEWRELCAVAADGVAVPVDWSAPTLLRALSLSLDMSACGRSDYNRILRWAHRSLRVRAEDADTSAYIKAVSGLLLASGDLMSSSNAGASTQGFRLLVDTEEYY